MNLIISAFAFKENFGNSMQLGDASDKSKLNIYMKNIVVALCSAKIHNPDDEVMLIANKEPAKEYADILASRDIKVSVVDFDDFLMPKEFPWALAFYKLCALKYAVTLDYDKILLIDSDTVTMKNFDSMWKEAEYGLLLYSVNHDFDHKDREVQREAYRKLFPDDNKNIVHYGGEFICGKRDVLKDFVDECHMIYEFIAKNNYDVNKAIGDEMILSAAAVAMREKNVLYEGGAYIYRYWTDNRFYLISTNTVSNPVCIWHIPSEKDRGFIWLYNYYRKNNSFPSAEKTAKIMGIRKAKRPTDCISFYTRFLRKKSNKQ